MQNRKSLHIIEPALNLPHGHQFSFFENICACSDGIDVHIYADRRFQYKPESKNIYVHPYFIKQIKKWQVPFLVRKLVKEDKRIFFPTAETTHLISLKYFSGKVIDKNRVFLFFHLINTDKGKYNIRNRMRRKFNFFSSVAKAQPNIVMFTPTETPRKFLLDCGYRYAYQVNYPVNPDDFLPQKEKLFRHLLLSGDPRSDKGLKEIGDYTDYCTRNKLDIPLTIQRPENFDNYPEDTKGNIKKILQYEQLNSIPIGLDLDTYLQQFGGAISLQLYDRILFADRASGVALDALMHGTPCITLSETWNAKLISRFGAGVVIDTPTPENIHAAVTEIINNYQEYSLKAEEGGKVVCKEHSMRNLLNLMMEDTRE